MEATAILRDEAVEAFFAGRRDPNWEQHEAFVMLDRDVTLASSGPVPPIGAALAALMRPASQHVTGLAVVPAEKPHPDASIRRDQLGPVDRRSNRRPRRLVTIVAGGVALAASALPAAAASNVLPEPAHRAVLRVLEVLTPFEFTHGPADIPPLPPPPVPTPPAASTWGPGNPATPLPGAPATSIDGMARPQVKPPGTPRPAPPATPTAASPGLDVAGRTPAGDIVPSAAGPSTPTRPADGAARPPWTEGMAEVDQTPAGEEPPRSGPVASAGRGAGR